MKFSELNDNEKIRLIKDCFMCILNEMLINPNEIKKSISEDKFTAAMEALEKIKIKDCACKRCIDMSKITYGNIPEFDCLIELSQERCASKTY